MPPLVWHPDYTITLARGRRFPMSKYGYLRAALVRRGMMPESGGYLAPAPAGLHRIARVHEIGYVERVFDDRLTPEELRAIGLGSSAQIARRSRLACAGTLLAARLALEHGLACNLAGGSHHAGPLRGAGYCVFNDVAFAARSLLDEGMVRRILVVDLDVHQGDGTARIFEGDGDVTTFSLHAEANYPREKARSSLDIGLPDATGDTAYLDTLSRALERLLAGPRPSIVFYNAGADPVAEDRIGRLALSRAGLAARDRMVLTRMRAAGLPVVTVLGGGYGHDPEEVAERHVLLIEAARDTAAA
ncbi:histone deacetylase [Oceanicella sp. SM1341]|uniref:histone deacetylase family protein n=1 Tax=Oceanicella sp. SM1341 TaxID=1548889 RepID=UPI0018E515A7|nr:histone deacetylase [Oceanicella sp. SM1341]